MTKNVVYKYLGTNGVLVTPIHLEGALGVKLYTLTADEDKRLTNGKMITKTVTVAEDDLDQWKEID